jgi:hypothetical protein
MIRTNISLDDGSINPQGYKTDKRNPLKETTHCFNGYFYNLFGFFTKDSTG